MPVFKLLDVIALLKDVPKKKLIKGQVGTIVEQLDDNYYEVEFINKKGETIALESLKGSDLFLLHFEFESA
ncbi:MAG: DUF4926 domain-containing protein [Cyclobacteriaceae bacterium]|nr:DUF4926 domain-containing protein [Cyclobacteriaceae bacterium]